MRSGTAFAVAIAGAALGGSPLAAASPTLERVEPDRFEAAEAVTLELTGSGFQTGARVFIESSRPGRFVGFSPTTVSPDHCAIALPFGLSAEPDHREIYLENPDGGRTRALKLRIGGAEPESDRGPPPEPGARADAEHSPDALEVPEIGPEPEISELRPAELPAGAPEILEIVGRGFAAGARVEVTVNLHAGSTRLPEYGPRVFPAERYGDDLLEVSFDRGFHRTPGIRDVVVVNPDGARSAPHPLRIRQQE
jgi:hypothetical protein